MEAEMWDDERVGEILAERDKAREELDDKTVALGEAEAWIARYAHERDAATSRAGQAEAENERLRDELRAARNDLLDVRGILSPNGYEPVTPLPLVPTVAPAVAWLVAERDRMRPVIEKAQAFRHADWRTAQEVADELDAAVDTYETQTGDTE